MIYLDYAAAAPIDAKVLAAMQPYFSDKFYNPSAVYGAARDVRANYREAKHQIASLIGAKPAEIIMTAGATESINLAFNVPRVKKSKILISSIEHPAVRAAATRETIFTRIGEITVDKHGRLDLDDLRNQLTNETILVSVATSNNEIGTVQPIREIAEIVTIARAERAKNGVKTPLYLHTDASQAAGLIDINVARLGVDMMTLNAGKCYGPKQVGCLYVRAGVRLSPLIVGGGQELGLRSGTENVASTVGFARALQIAEKIRKHESKRLGELRDNLLKYIESEIPNAVINGSNKHYLPNIINFSIPGVDGERLVYALDQHGILVATGAACAANKNTRSHVLSAIGLDDKLADSSIRISMGRGTTIDDIEKLKPILLKVIENERKIS